MKKVSINGVPCRVASWVNKSMLAQMREKPEVSYKLAHGQALAGWLLWSPKDGDLFTDGQQIFRENDPEGGLEKLPYQDLTGFSPNSQKLRSLGFPCHAELIQ